MDLRIVAVTRTFAVLAILCSGGAHAGAPNSCSFSTPAVVSAAIGQPVTGGTLSTVNDPSSSTSFCMYRAGTLIISLSVNQLASAAAARAEFDQEFRNSRGRDDDNPSQKTALISGLGDGAFYGADGPAIEVTGLRGSYVITIGVAGNGATAVSQEACVA
jgi:hypothetical protein